MSNARTAITVALVAALATAATACVVPVPPPPPPPPGPPAGTVGYVGCSNSQMTVGGYHTGHGPGRVWPAIASFGGGSVDQWVPGARHAVDLWTLFDSAAAAQPPAVVWLHVCTHPGATTAQGRAVVAELRNHIGATVPIYASPLATYQVAGECTMADPPSSAAIVDDLVGAGLAERGPTLTPLSPATTLSDGCHPNPAQQVVDGDVLAGFFP